jgi:hypothetical protein
MIEALISNITNPATISTLMKTENLMGFISLSARFQKSGNRMVYGETMVRLTIHKMQNQIEQLKKEFIIVISRLISIILSMKGSSQPKLNMRLTGISTMRISIRNWKNAGRN